jgi:opacity protein-like surface antigen
MKILLTAAALAIALAAPAAQARSVHHAKTSQVSSGLHAKAATKKTGAKAKHKKPAKKSARKA